MALINYYLKKNIKDFDDKVLNDRKQKSLYVCQKCGRLLTSEDFLSFNKITHCVFCHSKFIPLDDHIIDNSMNKNTNRILSL